jgi:hypothetical protein
MHKGRMFGSVWFAFAVAVMLIAQPVLAAAHLGGFALGESKVSSNGCDAEVYGAVPAVIDVRDGETVSFYYNGTWTDSRAPSLYVAGHCPGIGVDYQGNHYGFGICLYSYGASSGDWHFNPITVTVYQNTWIFVNWTLITNCDSPSCFDEDTDYGRVHLT